MTVCCTISASESAVPPCLIFPRVHLKHYIIRGAPVGTAGFGTKTGWIIFLEVFQTFPKKH